MFTPRFVTMGNKVFKVSPSSQLSYTFGSKSVVTFYFLNKTVCVLQVHVKYSARSVEVCLTPDSPVHQLKEKIQSEFNIDPDRQILHCNGKLMEAADNVTIKQAKIPNGSKILCTLSQKPVDPVVQHLDQIESSADELEISLDKLVKQRRTLLKEQSDVRHLKLESKKMGEHLMRLLESLDSVECNDLPQRSKRKQLATKMNSILDRNDKLGEKLNKDTLLEQILEPKAPFSKILHNTEHEFNILLRC